MTRFEHQGRSERQRKAVVDPDEAVCLSSLLSTAVSSSTGSLACKPVTSPLRSAISAWCSALKCWTSSSSCLIRFSSVVFRVVYGPLYVLVGRMANSSALLSPVSFALYTGRRFLRGGLSAAGAMGAFLFIGTIAKRGNAEVDCKGGGRSGLVLFGGPNGCSDEWLIPVQNNPENSPSQLLDC